MSGMQFEDIPAVERELSSAGYLADERTATAVFLGARLGKPVLVEGPAGTGKTELAKAVSRLTGARLVRLQCYEGLDESKALYEWDYRKQLLRIQAAHADWDQVHDDLFAEEFLLERPLLGALRSTEPVVLLIDEVDRVEVETEALLLEVLSDFQVSIPELGTVAARQRPLVFLTSNNTRDLSEALKRRCLFLPVEYPTVDREEAIVRLHVPGIDERLARQVAEAVSGLRRMDLQKSPSVSETVDWARSLVLLAAESVDASRLLADLPILLKNRTDIERASRSLRDAV